MYRKPLFFSILFSLSILVAGCAAQQSSGAQDPSNQGASGTPGAVATGTPGTTPTSALDSMFGASSTEVPEIDLSEGVSGIGEVQVAQDSDLVFSVQGTVQEVYIEEGDVVTKGQLLAILDVRTFDQQVKRAEAGLIAAQAGKDSLSESPSASDLAAAEAQIRQAEANLAYVTAPPEEVDVKAAQADVVLAEVNLQASRDRLSYAKTQAELQVQLSAYQLTQAQWQYALTQRYWEHADDEGTDPVTPDTINSKTGETVPNDLSEGKEASYRTSFEQAKAAMEQAEAAVNQSLVVAESARKTETTGVQAAEQQLTQAQIGLEKVLVPPDENLVSQAQASVDLASANRARLFPDPTRSQIVIANAQIADAESALELAKLNREYAELHAPFDGVISDVNVDPGDMAMSSLSAVRIVDVSSVYVEVAISDIDISKIDVGQSATATADTLPGKLFHGKVSYIAPSANVDGSYRSYKVNVKLDNTEGLRPGMSVRVEIEELAQP